MVAEEDAGKDLQISSRESRNFARLNASFELSDSRMVVATAESRRNPAASPGAVLLPADNRIFAAASRGRRGQARSRHNAGRDKRATTIPKRGPADAQRINVNEDYEVWAMTSTRCLEANCALL